MNILVTGSAGRIGRYVVSNLQAAGHTVLSVDLVPPPNEGHTLQVDLTQAGEIYAALAAAEAEAVIHMGAWANAGMVPDTRTYSENVSGTFNLFQACAEMGVKRVISASTNQIYGFAEAPPLYAPVDEAHPLRPVNCYALSKMAGEQAADYFVSNYDMTIASFRFMGVRPPEQLAPEIEAMAKDPASGSWLLWTRTDARDAARACRLAVEADDLPPGPYNITGAQVLETSQQALVEQYFGDRTEIRSELDRLPSLLSCDRAEAAFGYRPQYTWGESQQHL